ncbi:glycerophosphodiester phosphodiesterase [Dactylosporangium sucinum]|uniref:Glycerophosphoryl diester phosphodiesterase n=1 Tax=Dactylosporangium sucinum TaxID=1424081 RepID=A0A917WXU4_9ACTN|nr:glycerophosphodiester phosphodiesterase [Dactylosporangium sucinum]GGM37958.1 glycerophosphoryl diester phosphodiesterase [Dactylosporangium sucinum]
MKRDVPYLDQPGPLGFAHRGGAAAGDENTTAAFARAVELGYRYIETDTHATADGVAVVFHDDTLRRLLGRPGRMIDLRWADLASERVGGAAAVPRLDEVLEAWPQTRFNIDAKTDAAAGPTVDVVRRAGAEDRVLLASFSSARLARMRAAAGPRVATSLGMSEVARLWLASKAGRAVRLPDSVVAIQIPPRYGRIPLATPRFVGYAHRLGLQVHLWTIDDATQIEHFLDLGVDGIMTDHIEVLRDVYVRRGIWT